MFEALFITSQIMSFKLLVRAACLGAACAALTVHAQTPASLQDRLGALLGKPAQDQLLDPDQAFRVSVTAQGPDKLVAQVSPASGYYLYRDKLRFRLQDAEGVSIRDTRLPRGELKSDPTFGKTEVYHQPVTIELALARKGGPRSITVLASYQGCHEKLGVCYPPAEKAVKLTLP